MTWCFQPLKNLIYVWFEFTRLFLESLDLVRFYSKNSLGTSYRVVVLVGGGDGTQV